MTERSTAREIEHRLQFERLVLGVSTSFINLRTSEIDVGIEDALAQIGRFCQVDRAYVFSLGSGTMCNTHEWCAPGVEPQIDHLQDLPVTVFPWWVERIQCREVIHVPSVVDMPDEAAAEREILLDQDVVSIVVVPMVFEGRAIGFIGFDSIHHGKRWRDEDVTLLRISGEIVVNALERKRAETERSALEEQLIQARSLENVARLAGGVAHDFNNLLMVITSHAQALRRGCANPELDRSAEVLLKAAQQAAALTRQLMIVGRRELLPSETVDASAAVASLRGLLESCLGEAIELGLELTPRTCWVQLNQAHLEQVIVNLAVNARDALPDGGVVSIQTLLTEEPAQPSGAGGEGRWVCLRVGDNGVGMTEEVQRRAFEPFFSTKGSLGTGLGLSTLQSIVQRANGQTRIDSRAGAGTVVSVYLPRVAPPARSRDEITSPAPTHRGRQEQILLVEDSPELRELLERALREQGYRVATAAHPHTALAMADHELSRIDLLLTDVILPASSGRALARRLRSSRPAMRVAYMSGHDDQVLAKQGVVEEGIWLLPKPFSDDQLLAFVRAVLENPPGTA